MKASVNSKVLTSPYVGNSLLHLAAIENKPNVFGFLLLVYFQFIIALILIIIWFKNGADLYSKNTQNKLPLDEVQGSAKRLYELMSSNIQNGYY